MFLFPQCLVSMCHVLKILIVVQFHISILVCSRAFPKCLLPHSGSSCCCCRGPVEVTPAPFMYNHSDSSAISRIIFVLTIYCIFLERCHPRTPHLGEEGMGSMFFVIVVLADSIRKLIGSPHIQQPKMKIWSRNVLWREAGMSMTGKMSLVMYFL